MSTFMSTKECDHHHLLRHTYVCTYVHTYSVHCVCTHLVTEQQPQQELILFMSTLATPLTYLPHSFLFTFSLNHSYVPTLYIAHIHISPACLLIIVSPSLLHTDEDFEVLNDGTATFPNGSQMATVQIRALTDEIQEPDEVFTIEARLTDSSASLGVVIGGDGQADVVVEDMTAGKGRN